MHRTYMYLLFHWLKGLRTLTKGTASRAYFSFVIANQNRQKTFDAGPAPRAGTGGHCLPTSAMCPPTSSYVSTFSPVYVSTVLPARKKSLPAHFSWSGAGTDSMWFESPENTDDIISLNGSLQCDFYTVRFSIHFHAIPVDMTKTIKRYHWLSALTHRQPAHSMIRSAKVSSLPQSLISSSVKGKSDSPIQQCG
jgi:hypothetical protein